MLFSLIEDKFAIIRNKRGVYRQVKLYQRDEQLYAGCHGGYVRLMKEKRTSHPDVIWEHIEVAFNQPTELSGGLRVRSASLKAVA
jgi:hypothetical protein